MSFGIFNTVGCDIRRPKSLISANSHTQRTASFPGIERAVTLHEQSLATSGAPWYGDRCYLWSHFLKKKPHFHFSISIVPVLFHFLLNLFFIFMELIRKRPVYEFFELFLVDVLVLCMYFLPACWNRDIWADFFACTSYAWGPISTWRLYWSTN